ncbi:MAG: SPOR domain-containing protein, partial [Rhabdaerophilum sp.]
APVIAAKPGLTKERPANPGGIEIPNQNKQVLSPRNANDTQPAQVVNNTEQPLDLNQVTRRDGVRVVAPSPYQNSTGPAGETANPNLEPRRVTSVRIPVGGDPTTSATTTTTTAPAAPVAPSVPAPVTRPTPPAATPPQTAVNAPLPPIAPPGRTDPPASVTAPSATATPQVAPPKIEARPTTAQPPRPPVADTTRPAPPPAPRVATAPAAASSTTPANAPMVLSPNTRPAAPATAARPAPPTNPDSDAPPPSQPTSGAFAVQLASRPTEEDARNASTQLRTRFGSALGGKAPSVVSGTANGQTVYRVRVGGYSQAAAVEACNKVKAAGGSCFVTRQ